MDPDTTMVETAIATLQRMRPDLMEIRYNKGCTLSAVPMTEVQVARRRLMSDTQYGMLTLLPGDVDFELPAMRVDHLDADRRDGLVLATAVVAAAHMIEMLVKIYFSYYPQLHRIHVCSDEAEARVWLQDQLNEIALQGK